MPLKKYYTGLATEINKKFPRLLNGKGFTISFKEYNKMMGTLSGHRLIPYKNIIITCASYERACEIAQLIYESNVIINGYEPNIIKNGKKFPYSPIETVQEIRKNFVPSNYSSYKNNCLRGAVRMVTKASYRHKYIWAINKLFLSYRLVSVPPVETAPTYRVIDKPTLREYLPSINIVTKAFSIVIAYAVIEELGFSTPSNEKFSREKFKEWKKKYKNKLIKKLKNKKISLNEKFIWLLRGPKTCLEKELFGLGQLNFQKTQWSRDKVRDIEIDIPDAIYFASFLRNKVCAHVLSREGNKKRIRTLSLYEVCNVQDLARRLLLCILGLWRKNLC